MFLLYVWNLWYATTIISKQPDDAAIKWKKKQYYILLIICCEKLLHFLGIVSQLQKYFGSHESMKAFKSW